MTSDRINKIMGNKKGRRVKIFNHGFELGVNDTALLVIYRKDKRLERYGYKGPKAIALASEGNKIVLRKITIHE